MQQHYGHKQLMHMIQMPNPSMLLIFPSGCLRIIGKANFNPFNIIVYLTKGIPHSSLKCKPHLQSETAILTFNKQIYLYIHSFNSHKYIDYELEIFLSLCLNLWSTIMVNLFSTVKAIVMGREARLFLDQIYI